jgi:glyoxylase-like metal-dependent hydrolase (beta-lactamase superfamily II)
MEIKQFFDEGLAHLSYAIIDKDQMVLIDPARNPQPYINLANERELKFNKILLTHTHADFAGGHCEISNLYNAEIYCSAHANNKFDHIRLEDSDEFIVGACSFMAYHTPGHTRDSMTYILADENGKPAAVFTGDTLFPGDVGRPDIVGDLADNPADQETLKNDLAHEMYRSLHKIFFNLPEDITIYPAHGPGSLCGKNIGNKKSTILADEIRDNWALQSMSPDEFVPQLLQDQPFIPPYWYYDRKLNQEGAKNFEFALGAIPKIENHSKLDKQVLIVDTRPASEFRKNHFPNSINLMNKESFETWLGTFVSPGQSFYLTASNREQLDACVARIAKIGYEDFVKGVFIYRRNTDIDYKPLDLADFKNYPENYFVLDIRNSSEVESQPIFKNSMNIPLPELPEKVLQLQSDKPVLVHCSGGYRSAIAYSILVNARKDLQVFDLGDNIKDFQ